MPDTKLIASLFDRLNQHQLVLGAVVEELFNWAKRHGGCCLQPTRRA